MVKLRLVRLGAKKHAFYRIVAMDERKKMQRGVLSSSSAPMIPNTRRTPCCKDSHGRRRRVARERARR